jgi:hypothetical protein
VGLAVVEATVTHRYSMVKGAPLRVLAVERRPRETGDSAADVDVLDVVDTQRSNIWYVRNQEDIGVG